MSGIYDRTSFKERGIEQREPLQFPLRVAVGPDDEVTGVSDGYAHVIEPVEPFDLELPLVMQVHKFMLEHKVYMRHDKSIMSSTLKATLVADGADFDSVVVQAGRHFNKQGIIELDINGAMAEYERAMARLVKRYLADNGWKTDDIDAALEAERVEGT